MRRVIAATALAAAALTVAAAGTAQAVTPPTASGGPATATLPDSVAPFAVASRALGAVPAAAALTVQFWLAPQSAAAESSAAAASTPGSPQYREFLSPAQYTARFGATPAAASGVESWLKSAGFGSVTVDPGRDYVQATAPVSVIDSALKVSLKYYQATSGVSAGPNQLRANDRAVSLPAGLAGSVLGVTGLDNAAPVMTYAKMGGAAAAAGQPKPKPKPKPKPPGFPCSKWYLQHYATSQPKLYGATRFPTDICGYSPQQLRRSYGYEAKNSGRGVSVALVEVGLVPDMFTTLRDYAKKHQIQAPSAQRYRELSLGQGSACGDPFDVEEQMDVEAAYDMAPLASQLVV